MRSWLTGAIVVAACVAAYAQSPSTIDSNAAAPLVPAGLLRALGSADFPEREAAQKALDSLPLERRDALAQLAATIADPEVHARLLARVDAIDDELAINPLPVSLDVKDASPQQLAEALGRSLNVSMHATVAAARAGDRFTLSVKDGNFWDVFYQLHKQNPITFNRDGLGSWILYDDGGRADTPLEITKGFLVEVSRATPHSLPAAGLRLAVGPGGNLVAIDDSPHFPGGLAVTFRLTAEPRMNVLSMKFNVQSNVSDDEGRPLAVISADPAAAKANDISWSATALIGTPEQVGKTIKAMKVTAVMTAAVDTQRVVVDHPEQMIDKPIQVGHATFTIRRFAVAGGQANYGVDVAAGTAGATICMIDGTGQRIARNDFQNAINGGVGLSSGIGQPPYKLEFTAARAMKEITLPMEWHDIPIDGKPAVSGTAQGVVVVPGGAIGGGNFIISGDILRIDGVPLQPAPAVQPQNSPVLAPARERDGLQAR